jgi:hypothetical protein
MIVCLSNVSSWYDVVTEAKDIDASRYEDEFVHQRQARDRTHKILLYSYFRHINTQPHRSPVSGARNALLFPPYESLSILPPVSASAILWILSWLIAM